MKNTCIALLLAGLSATSLAAAEEFQLSDIEGTWGRDGCKSYIHKIALTENKEFLRFTEEGGSYFYYVAGMTERGLKLVMLGEDRLDSKKNPVSWYIVFEDKNSFAWLRSDRKSRDLREPTVRCEPAK